jgi:hypothetical protein
MPYMTPAPAPAPQRSRESTAQLQGLVADLEDCFRLLLNDDEQELAFTGKALGTLIAMCATDLRDAIEQRREARLIAHWRDNAATFRARLLQGQESQSVRSGDRSASVYLISEEHLAMVFENCPKPYSDEED